MCHVFQFHFRHKFPNVIGAIDGCHLEIELHEENKFSFYNFKQYHLIHLMATCLHDMKFIDAFAGWPGHTHDHTVFRNSPLCKYLVDLLNIPGTQIQDTYHLIGDSVYPLLQQIMIPYKRTSGPLTRAESKFNLHLSS